MTSPKDYPLESSSPHFENILLRGARGEDFTIQCRSVSEAHRLQHMLHSFRHRARKYHGEDSERWRPLYIAVVGLMKDENGKRTIVHVYSRHDEFKEILDPLFPESAPSLDQTSDRTDPLDEFFPNNAKPEGSGG